jgi:hypothetical protein
MSSCAERWRGKRYRPAVVGDRNAAPRQVPLLVPLPSRHEAELVSISRRGREVRTGPQVSEINVTIRDQGRPRRIERYRPEADSQTLGRGVDPPWNLLSRNRPTGPREPNPKRQRSGCAWVARDATVCRDLHRGAFEVSNTYDAAAQLITHI